MIVTLAQTIGGERVGLIESGDVRCDLNGHLGEYPLKNYRDPLHPRASEKDGVGSHGENGESKGDPFWGPRGAARKLWAVHSRNRFNNNNKRL